MLMLCGLRVKDLQDSKPRVSCVSIRDERSSAGHDSTTQPLSPLNERWHQSSTQTCFCSAAIADTHGRLHNIAQTRNVGAKESRKACYRTLDREPTPSLSRRDKTQAEAIKKTCCMTDSPRPKTRRC